MQARKLEMACPVCGSAGVFYSCTPNCCFNHVCGECGGTFEPVTRVKGPGPAVTPPDPLPDASDPTAACARCESTAVYMMADGGLVCGSCRSLLELEYTEISVATEPG